jgi:hypothetical protein
MGEILVTISPITRRVGCASSGSALLMAVVTSAILYLAAATLLLLTMTEMQIADFESRSVQAFYAAESSVTLGLARLRQEPHYRAVASETMMVGGAPALLTVSVAPQVFDNTPALYHLTLRGVGAVPGPQAATIRRVERHVVIKPFALLAREAVTIGEYCRITGNVHGNGPVLLAPTSRVSGNVSSSVSVAATDPAITVTTLIADGQAQPQEPAITIPNLDVARYYPTYWYQGMQGQAQPLTVDALALSADGADEPPAPHILVYSGIPTPDNPARIFYPDHPLEGPLTAIDLDGTLVIPPQYAASTLTMTGPLRITPVANLPAIISARDIDLTIMNGEDLRRYASSLKKTRITGLIYGSGQIILRGQATVGQEIVGSVVGATIVLDTAPGTAQFQATYDAALLTAPPPGLDFLELGDWREVFGP